MCPRDAQASEFRAETAARADWQQLLTARSARSEGGATWPEACVRGGLRRRKADAGHHAVVHAHDGAAIPGRSGAGPNIHARLKLGRIADRPAAGRILITGRFLELIQPLAGRSGRSGYAGGVLLGRLRWAFVRGLLSDGLPACGLPADWLPARGGPKEGRRKPGLESGPTAVLWECLCPERTVGLEQAALPAVMGRREWAEARAGMERLADSPELERCAL